MKYNSHTFIFLSIKMFFSNNAGNGEYRNIKWSTSIPENFNKLTKPVLEESTAILNVDLFSAIKENDFNKFNQLLQNISKEQLPFILRDILGGVSKEKISKNRLRLFSIFIPMLINYLSKEEIEKIFLDRIKQLDKMSVEELTFWKKYFFDNKKLTEEIDKKFGVEIMKYEDLPQEWKDKFEEYVYNMDKDTYGEYGPDYLDFLKGIIDYKNKIKDPLYDVIVLKNNSDIVGIVGIVDDDQDMKKNLGIDGIFIGGLNVNPLYRSLGYGKWIFKEAIRHIEKYYKGNVWLFTDNDYAKSIYIQNGFVILNKVINKYGDEEVLMCSSVY